MKYPGGKNHGSSYPRIINQIPPHTCYIEPFAGSAAIRRMMKPCPRSILLDLDPGALGSLAEVVPPGTELIREDALAWLDRQAAWLGNPAEAAGVVMYCDPPYLPEVCASRLRYRHVLTREDHRQLLTRLNSLRCHVLISGYWSGLYASLLQGWRLIHWPQITRGGTIAEECLWLNFPEPVKLHDYRHLGLDFRERQDIKRLQHRWRRRLAAMTVLKQQALLSVLADVEPGALGENAVRIHAPGTIGTSAATTDGDATSTNSRSTNGTSTESARASTDPHTAELPSGASSGGTAEKVLEPRQKRRVRPSEPAGELGRHAEGRGPRQKRR